MSDSRRQFGQAGEEIAARYLEQHGYRIIARNYRTRAGEIDIIARDRDTLVFVEVKTRRSVYFGNPKYAVDRRKQQKISRAALFYLQDTGQSRVKARFDVVSILSAGGRTDVELVKNAFDLARF